MSFLYIKGNNSIEVIKMKKVFSIFLLSVLLLFTACTPTKPQQKPTNPPKTSSIFKKGNVEQIKVIKNDTPCHSGFSEESPVIEKLPQNKICNVIGQKDNWYIIQTDQGNVAAIDSSQVEPYIETPSLANQEENAAKLTPNEDEMLRLVNGERIKNGLNPLKLDIEITKVARLKSKDMAGNNYFSHNSPTYGNPFEMMKRFGIKYIYAGENIAQNPSVQNAHQSLMDSEGHRKNILNPEFTHIGIGIKEDSKYGKLFTQMFVGR